MHHKSDAQPLENIMKVYNKSPEEDNYIYEHIKVEIITSTTGTGKGLLSITTPTCENLIRKLTYNKGYELGKNIQV